MKEMWLILGYWFWYIYKFVLFINNDNKKIVVLMLVLICDVSVFKILDILEFCLLVWNILL